MCHDCNTDFEKIRKRIEEEKNKCKKCYIQGPERKIGGRGVGGGEKRKDQGFYAKELRRLVALFFVGVVYVRLLFVV